jgi:hypothetical protein
MTAPLGRMQRWMQQVVVHPGSVDQAVAAPDAVAAQPSERIADIILPSAQLTPVERVGIYHGMYLLRMEEALQVDYPGLAHFLGGARFRELVRGYVQQHPSRSYTLNRLGDHLPDYVQTAVGIPRRAFCHDLARLELAVSQVFDAEEAPSLTADEVAAVPPDAWEGAVLQPIPALRVLTLRYPVNAYLSSVREDRHDHPPTRQRASFVAIYRRDYAIYRKDIQAAAHDLLADLVAGRTLGEAITAATARPGRRAPSEEELFGWFRGWIGSGLFRSVRAPK